MSAYVATAERNGRTWRVAIEGLQGAPNLLLCPELVDVESRLRRYIYGYTGRRPDDIDLRVEVRLPPSIQVRLELAEELCEDATLEVERAIAELIELGASLRDVAWVLCHRRRETGSESVA